MQITILPSNEVISQSDLIESVLRHDLIPVPVSLEFSVKMTKELRGKLVEGVEILVGDMVTTLTIIKVQPFNTQTIKNGERIGGISCIAILSGCVRLIEPRSTALIMDDISFNTALRASGYNMRLDGDVPLPQYVCFKGIKPTVRLALYLQQEAAVIAFQDNKIIVQKIDSIFKQEPKAKIDSSSIAWVESGVVEKLQKRTFVSVDNDGSTLLGAETKQGFEVIQKAGLSERELKNLEKILICRGVFIRPLNYKLNAGDVVQVDEKKYVILTSAHKYSSGAMGGSTVTASKYWIASL